ncbi:MAG: hypothetical protein PHE68_01510 [Candidatus Peribacteraceae bacterium]|nr:hypothetical protein [Candidatus Peribacteraceae bacterium]MDD5075370.1 hypothetical protein [Candidatus Peribacteraceae bacterium]
MNNSDPAIQFVIMLATVIAAVAACLAAWWARDIGQRQNEINARIGEVQDSVELYATPAVKRVVDRDDKTLSEVPALHIQNVGTRHVYFDRYNFNGRIYELKGQVRPPTYSGAENNFYWIELPTNGEAHVSVVVEYHDMDNRKWKSKIVADLQNGSWLVTTFPRESGE